ncbi:C39 family peptidase [Niallia sp. JL1B1071]|uniref:C39 family peptidase n=1 Tax=Niallia tiangongensis TaxID=3237105 RepID=UPI0037DCF520
MNSNTLIVISLITLFFLLYLLVRKKLNTLAKSIYLFTIFAMIAISFLLINRNDIPAMVYAKEVATQNTRKALLSTKEETDLLKESVLLDAPIVNQLPELPRGCEVTSLAMLLQYADVDVDKMTLAKEIKKDSTPYVRENSTIYYGNPNDGFIGDMYSLNGPGLGVYHKPIAALAEQYLPGSIVDFTGSDFKEIKKHLSSNHPVLVITNSTFKKLPESEFRTWHTPSGTVKITYSEHSVLITGYDEKYIYFNDPLTEEKNKKAPITDFEESWVQMGSQAITINS